MSQTTTSERRPSLSIRPLTVMTGGALLPYLAGSGLALALRDQTQANITFFQLLPWMIKRDGLTPAEIGMQSRNLPLDLLLGLGYGGLLWILISLTYNSLIFLPQNLLAYFPLLVPPLPALVYLFISAISGELVFRGYGMNSLRKRSSAAWALLVTSLLTAAAAWPGGWLAVAVWLMMGLMLGTLTLIRSGSMITALVARLTATVIFWAAGSFLMLVS